MQIGHNRMIAKINKLLIKVRAENPNMTNGEFAKLLNTL